MSLILFTVLVSVNSHAQSLKLKYEGQDGNWFPREMAQQILADVKIVPLLKLEVGELKLKLELKDERILALKDAVTHAETAEKRAVDSFEAAIHERDIAIAEVKKWYRHPALWISVGIVTTVLIQIVAVKSFQAISD